MHLADGEYLNPSEQSYLQWDAKQEFLDSVTRMNPEVLDDLRRNVFPIYPRAEQRSAFYFLRHYSRFAPSSPSSINQEIPRFAYRMALGVSPHAGRWRFATMRRYLDAFPDVPQELAFSDHDWDEVNVLQDWERRGLLPFEPAAFVAEFDDRVPAHSRQHFSDVLAETMDELREALENWGRKFALTAPWVYSNALETMYYGAFAPQADWFPQADRWEYTDDQYFSANPPAPPSPPMVSRHSFVWDPRKERRRDARARLNGLKLPMTKKREVVDEIARVAQAYRDAGWYQAPLSRLERHHHDWAALVITKHLTSEQMLDAYIERLQELGEWREELVDNLHSPSSIHRGIRQVCKLVDLPNPLRRGRPRTTASY